VTSLFACFGLAILMACPAQRSNNALLRCCAQLIAAEISSKSVDEPLA
jgi:hypothetical protein